MGQYDQLRRERLKNILELIKKSNEKGGVKLQKLASELQISMGFTKKTAMNYIETLAEAQKITINDDDIIYTLENTQ